MLAWVIVAAAFDPASAQTRSVTLQWDPNTEKDLAGYLVFVGPSSTTVEQRLDVGKTTTRTITVPQTGTRYAWVVAYNSAGIQSQPSNVLSLSATQAQQNVGDVDGDGLPDLWEQMHGVTAPNDDHDGDGVVNRDEYTRGTDPRLPNTWVFAEGANGTFLQRLSLVNPGSVDASGVVIFRVSGAPRQVPFLVTPRQRITMDVNQLLAGAAAQAFVTVVQTDRGGVVVERTMQWSTTLRSGLVAGHTAVAAPSPSREWIIPELQTSGYESFLLVANENDMPATVQVEYRTAANAVVTRAYPVTARGRTSIAVHAVPGLPAGAAWARVRSNVPVFVERSMFLVRSGVRGAGDLVPGVPAASSTWYFAEGATGAGFDTYLVLVNPQATTVIAQIAWLRPTGAPVREARFLPPNSRTVIAADAVSTLSSALIAPAVVANGAIVAERLTYWPGAPLAWHEFHSRSGTAALGTRWVFAEGEVGGALAFDTVVVLANPGLEAATVRVTPLKEAGTATTTTVTVAGGTRVLVRLRDLGLSGRMGVLLESQVPIAAERSMYWTAAGVTNRGGTNSGGYRVW